ncbi:hypothetical protein [Pelagibaculum spongiae]|uniref:DUF4105 domain-containing protein n=1 Tax=Pelagibaculum spongiae TaxID=2080658 RepID=A0A2V1GVR5_9GAMM|nr:hypothetical protein [Pelagibaculum spongiae]PVZ63901.1 hypothetical protein DC094_20450 [Pelagibaculum spongiae]
MSREQISATVYVWLPYDQFNKTRDLFGNIGSYGHAAMQILENDESARLHNYVSWWPDGHAGKSSILPGKKFGAQKNISLMEDNRSERVSLGQISHQEQWRLLSLDQNNPQVIESLVHGNYAHRFLGLECSEWDYDDQVDQQVLKFLKNMFHFKHGAGASKQFLKPWSYNLSGLNCRAMIEEWASIRTKPDAHYRTLRKNCSTIVARVLRAGGIDQHTSFGNRHHLVWTPQMIFNLCQQYQKRQAKRRR